MLETLRPKVEVMVKLKGEKTNCAEVSQAVQIIHFNFKSSYHITI